MAEGVDRPGGVKVLYVAGFGRSGSTLLDNLLGQVDGVFSAGELCYMWQHDLPANGLCGCGRSLPECEVWGNVLADERVSRIDAREMAQLESKGARTRHLPLMLAGRGRKALAGRLRRYIENLGGVYRAVRDVTGAGVIVDSSKSPAYGRVLEMVPGIDLHVVQLVRDPRAAAYSWLKSKHQPDRGELGLMDQHPPAKSAAMWTAWNAAAEAFWRNRQGRYMLLRYEDFVRSPGAALAGILPMVGMRDASLPFVDGRTVDLGVTHTVAGNPNRFKTGTATLRLDDEWRGRMKAKEKMLVTALTLPGLVRFGYPVLAAGRGL